MKMVYSLADLQDWEAAGAPLTPPAKLCVFGDPVEHSLSPQMHNPALHACGIDAQYIRLHVGGADFAKALRHIQKLGFFGANVTIPHKFTALKSVDVVDPQAMKLGAVNTILFRNGQSVGRNSDGPGFLRAVKEGFGAAVSDLRILILGAGGGAGRAVAVQCALEHCAQLTLANRTSEKTTALRDEMKDYFPESRVRLIDWSPAALATALPDVDLIINGTNLGMSPDDAPLLPDNILEARHFVYDMVYKPLETPFVKAARAAGAKAINGLPMLLHQGAVSFEWWFDRPAPIEDMRAGLLAAIR